MFWLVATIRGNSSARKRGKEEEERDRGEEIQFLFRSFAVSCLTKCKSFLLICNSLPRHHSFFGALPYISRPSPFPLLPSPTPSPPLLTSLLFSFWRRGSVEVARHNRKLLVSYFNSSKSKPLLSFIPTIFVRSPSKLIFLYQIMRPILRIIVAFHF